MAARLSKPRSLVNPVNSTKAQRRHRATVLAPTTAPTLPSHGVGTESARFLHLALEHDAVSVTVVLWKFDRTAEIWTPVDSFGTAGTLVIPAAAQPYAEIVEIFGVEKVALQATVVNTPGVAGLDAWFSGNVF